MGGSVGVGGVTPVLIGAQFAIEFQARSLRTQLETIEELGRLTVELIRSAALPSDPGARLDINA